MTSEAISDGSKQRQSAGGFPEPVLQILPWPDVVLDQLGHDPRSPYVERFWLSVLGPTATLLLRRLADGLDAEPEGFDLETVTLSQELGIGDKGGKNSPLWRTLDRTCRFGATHRNGSILAVRAKLPPLALRQVERMPSHLRAAHTAWQSKQIAPGQQSRLVDNGASNQAA